MKLEETKTHYIITLELEEERKRLRHYQPKSKDIKTFKKNDANHSRLLMMVIKDLHHIGFDIPNLESPTATPSFLLDPLPQVGELKPMQHQEIAIRHMLAFNQHAVFLEMGLGKTFTTLFCIRHWFENIQSDKNFLIIAPKGVMPEWANEAKKFGLLTHVCTQTRCRRFNPDDCSFTPTHENSILGEKFVGKFRLIVLSDEYSRKNKSYLVEENHDLPGAIFLANYESFVPESPITKLILEEGIKFDVCVLDESVRIRYSDIKLAQGLKLLQEKGTFKKRYILTGLPAPQSPADYINQIAFLHPVYLGFNSRGSFENACGVRDLYGRIRSWKKLRWLHERLHDVSTVIKCSDSGLKLPAKNYVTKTAEMTPIQKDLYDKIATEFITYIENLPQHGNLELLAPGILAKLIRLSQLTGGFVCGLKKTASGVYSYGDIDEEEVEKIPPQAIPDGNPKFNMIKEIIEDVAKPIVICARFTHELDMMHEYFESIGLRSFIFDGRANDAKRLAFKNDWEEEKIDICLLQTAVKYGLNLQRAAVQIFYSNDYNYDSRGQLEKRLDRPGSIHSCVTIIDLVCDNSIDGEILHKLLAKKSIAELFLKNPRLVLPTEYINVTGGR